MPRVGKYWNFLFQTDFIDESETLHVYNRSYNSSILTEIKKKRFKIRRKDKRL
jgi:hypothetical protein